MQPCQAGTAGLHVDAHHDGFRRRPGPHDRVVAPVDLHLLINPLGRTPEGELAKRDQIALGEEILNRKLDLFRDIHFPIFEPL